MCDCTKWFFIAFLMTSVGCHNKSSATKVDAEQDPGSGLSSAVNTLELPAPTSLIYPERSNSLSESPLLSWDYVDGAVSYEIAIGTIQGATNVLDWTDVGMTTTISKTGLSLPNGAMLYASVRGVAIDGTKGVAAEGGGWQNLVCPTKWVKIFGNTTPGLGGDVYVHGTRTRHDGTTRDLSDFCVMKYDMKLRHGAAIVEDGDVDDNGFNVNYTNPGDVHAVSTHEGRPWVRIRRTDPDPSAELDAERACSNIRGTGLVSSEADDHFYLINNAQWQAIVRNIESDPRNESDGKFNRGNSNNSSSLAASSDDQEGCFGIGSHTHDGIPVAADCGGEWHVNKRTHTLTNDEVIWDISGNVWNWVIDDVGTGKNIDPDPNLSGKEWIQFTNATCGSGSNELCFSLGNRLTFGPENAALSSNENIGRFFGGAGPYGGAMYRGGIWYFGINAGLFCTSVSASPSYEHIGVGARCVWAP